MLQENGAVLTDASLISGAKPYPGNRYNTSSKEGRGPWKNKKDSFTNLKHTTPKCKTEISFLIAV